MNCYDCGAEMLPAVFNRRPDGTPVMPIHSGFDAGEVVDDMIWVCCPDGHRGAWVHVSDN